MGKQAVLSLAEPCRTLSSVLADIQQRALGQVVFSGRLDLHSMYMLIAEHFFAVLAVVNLLIEA